MRLTIFGICGFLRQTSSRSSREIGRASTAFASTTSIAFVSSGPNRERKELSFVTTIHDFISTPGEILLEEFLEPLGISQYRLAQTIGKPQSAISDIVHGRRSISTEMACLLSAALGTSPEFWLNLQMTYDLKTFDEAILASVPCLL
ncbi:HigA family addiction module antidote protein [Eggerthellaceae bacterium zg-886]|uniref:HigA family addiction module antidote protein n=1 Tax=Xiamenia xianingshaonis TaxID=2682776 RepID=A0A9E6SUY9_9ACTN|nr:HigA family addiction module antidote protein [Xiamenia xianingshaonis]QTU85026.1 HigA family addiction module antidote protein [Xiamenia xianingshaonis]